MKDLNQKIKVLIEKLSLAKEIYEKASSAANDAPMRKQMKGLMERKQSLINNLAVPLGINASEVNVSFSEGFKIGLEKGLMDFDSAMLRVNEKAVLRFCVEREEELVEAYRDVMKDDTVDQDIKSVVQIQLDESMQLLTQLKEAKSEYEFIENAEYVR